MNFLNIDNNYSQLITADEKIKNRLWESLRFRQRGYFFTRLYRQKLWDGCVDFFHKSKGIFLTGLLPEVQFALNHWQIPYQIKDNRENFEFTQQSIDVNFLNKWLPKGHEPITLEDYQVDLVNQSLKHKRGIITAPTASGKTFCLISIMKCLPPNTPTLFLANTTDLVYQNYEEMIKWGLENVGRFDGEAHEANMITCATIQSIHHLDKVLHKFKALFVDEVHLMTSTRCTKAYKKLTGCSVRLCMSATPFKFQVKKKDKIEKEDKVQRYTVKGWFGPAFETDAAKTGQLKAKDLQERGRLSKSVCYFYPITEPQIPHDVYIDAVTRGVADSWHLHKITTSLAKKLTGRTLILVERLSHGDALHNLLPDSLWVRGQDNRKTRKFVIERLKDSPDNLIAIATAKIFSAGVNFFIHNFINCSGGQASHDVVQRIGRGLRPAKDKEILSYYDFIFDINPYLLKHSMERIKILKLEGHEVIIKNEIDF